MRALTGILTAVAIATLGAGCSSAGTASTGMSGDRLTGEARASSANVITAEEISRQTFKNAWQAILSLRPTWPKTVGAYVNQRRSSLENLQDVPIESVVEIRLLSREQARVRFGPEAQQSILVVVK